MNKNMKTRYISLFCAGMMMLGTSCEDKLDIAQHGVLNYDTYYQTDEDAQGAATAIYLEMRGLTYNYTLGKNCLGDDFWAGGGGRNDNAQLEQLNEFTYATDQEMIQGMFQSYYKIIYRANVVLGHVSEETETMKRVRAEAKVFRAWSYFELITLWGNPPLVDHELASNEYSKPNGTTEELWALVEQDLTEAIASGALKQKSNVNDQSVWQVTKQFAQAVLGKAYLWQKKYSEAATVLDQVISSELYKLYDGPYDQIMQYDNEMNCESLFESIRVDDPNNVYDNWDLTMLMIHWRTDKMTVTSDYFGNGWGFLNPQKGLYEDFVKEEGENGYRLTNTMKTYRQMLDLGMAVKKDIINEGYFMWKWRFKAGMAPASGNGFCTTNNPRWMRYAEVLLLAAEAHLEAGNSSKAEEYLNEVRNRAQLPAKSDITLADIQIEKRLELCGEGLRFQDMTRWGIAYDRMKDQGKVCPNLDSNGNVTYLQYNKDANLYGFKKGKHELLPYPGIEIRLNPNIVQNPGW